LKLNEQLSQIVHEIAQAFLDDKHVSRHNLALWIAKSIAGTNNLKWG
jgi:predicted NACHT family NTPase